MSDAGLPPDTAKLLAEIGFLAAGHGRTPQARTIFEGVRALRPDGEEWVIGMAFAQMCDGKADEAIRLLAPEAGKADRDLARVFLGWALKLAGRTTDAMRIFDDIARDSGDERLVRIAKGLMAA